MAVALPGDPRDLRTWSGIPAAMCRALEAHGVVLSALDTRPSGLLSAPRLNLVALAYAMKAAPTAPAGAFRRARWQAKERPAAVRARSAVLDRQLAQAGPLDALLQIHAQCVPAAGLPMATYEDLTMVQAIRHGYAEFAHMAERDRLRRIAQQGMAYERASVCCTTSRWARRSIIDDYGVPPGRVHAVGIGADRPVATEGRDWSTPRFLFVGRDWDRKNGDAVLAAFARVRATVGRGELHLVGGHPRVDQDGVHPHGALRLERADERGRVDELYRRATCFVMPSKVEPSAVAYVEAGAAGIASIGTSVGGGADLIGDGGVLVEPGDVEGLVQAMLRFTSPAEAAASGARAQARSRLFTWARVSARVLTCLGLPGFDEPPLWVDDEPAAAPPAAPERS